MLQYEVDDKNEVCLVLDKETNNIKVFFLTENGTYNEFISVDKKPFTASVCVPFDLEKAITDSKKYKYPCPPCVLTRKSLFLLRIFGGSLTLLEKMSSTEATNVMAALSTINSDHENYQARLDSYLLDQD